MTAKKNKSFSNALESGRVSAFPRGSWRGKPMAVVGASLRTPPPPHIREVQ